MRKNSSSPMHKPASHVRTYSCMRSRNDDDALRLLPSCLLLACILACLLLGGTPDPIVDSLRATKYIHTVCSRNVHMCAWMGGTYRSSQLASWPAHGVIGREYLVLLLPHRLIDRAVCIWAFIIWRTRDHLFKQFADSRLLL